MAYQTGTAATPDQLLDALRVFAVANGWTQLNWAASGTGQALSLSKGGHIVHLRSTVNERLRSGYSNVTGLFLTASMSWDDTQPWNNQPGTIRNTSNQIEACGLYEVSTSNPYHLFALSGPDMILLVAEVSPGIYHHLAFGVLARHGTYTGGLFVSGSYGSDGYIYNYNTTNNVVFGYPADRHGGIPFNDYKSYGQNFIHAEVDGFDGWFSVCSNSPRTGKRARALFEGGQNSNNSLGRMWYSRVPNTLNGVSPMLPFTLFVERPDGYVSPFGYTPHLRYLNITHYSPAESFTLGAEQWRVFPAHSKNGKSGVHGYAVKVTT
ncbi:MAG: hypothetical protein AB2669_08340 [Candidatus Thiodiazotropha endolucinida]